MKTLLNEAIAGLRNTGSIKLKPAKNLNCNPNSLNINYTHTALNPSKQLKNKNLKALVLSFLVGIAVLLGLNKCTPEPIVTPQEPISTDTITPASPEDIEFARNAREQLESNPILLQSCLEYINEHHLFNSANDFLTGNYPAEWKINVVMACIMGDADMKAWFSGQIG